MFNSLDCMSVAITETDACSMCQPVGTALPQCYITFADNGTQPTGLLNFQLG